MTNEQARALLALSPPLPSFECRLEHALCPETRLDLIQFSNPIVPLNAEGKQE